MKSADGDFSFDYLFKIVLIGDPGVGKTCIVQRFKKGTFIEKHGSTIGVDFTMKTLEVDSKKIKVSCTKCNLHIFHPLRRYCIFPEEILKKEN